MSGLNGRLRKLDDRLGLASETIAQLHLRALREDERRKAEEAGASSELKPPESGQPVERWRQILLSRSR
jgi:hypothetical protein